MLDIDTNNLHNYVLDIIGSKVYKSKQVTPKKRHKRICIFKF